MKFQPRNDWVLIRIVEVGVTEQGIAMPASAIEGKEFHVIAAGPDVKDLKPGNKVLMIGQDRVNYFKVPASKDLIVIREEHVVLVER